jgi:hypothetical protein
LFFIFSMAVLLLSIAAADLELRRAYIPQR